MNESLRFKLDSKLKNRLKKVSESTGLNYSEIARRGVLEEINRLEDR